MLRLYNCIFVIPLAKRDFELAPYSIRGNPVTKGLVPRLRGDDVWMLAFAGMTALQAISILRNSLSARNDRVRRSRKDRTGVLQRY
ncbi:MAG: hypothetical protein ABFD82_15850 [Syntrophaceae bacterium]